MNPVKILKELVKFTKPFIEGEILPFYLPVQEYSGYIVVSDSFEKQTNKANQYFIKGYIFKQFDALEEKESFSFLGKKFTKDDDFISFTSKKVQVIDMQDKVERGFALTTPFEAKITLPPEEEIGEISKVYININNETEMEVKK